MPCIIRIQYQERWEQKDDLQVRQYDEEEMVCYGLVDGEQLALRMCQRMNQENRVSEMIALQDP
jgi:hypothetical protein